MKRLAFPSNRKNVVSGLGGTIPDQEVTIVRHFRFSAFSTTPECASVIPGVRSQVSRIQKSKFSLQKLSSRFLWWILN